MEPLVVMKKNKTHLITQDHLKNNSKYSHSQKGQVLIEFIFSFILLIKFIIFLITLIYYFLAKLWISHHLHNSLICISSEHSIAYCKSKYQEKIIKNLPWGKLKKFNIIKTKNFINGKIVFTLAKKIYILEKIKISDPVINNNNINKKFFLSL